MSRIVVQLEASDDSMYNSRVQVNTAVKLNGSWYLRRIQVRPLVVTLPGWEGVARLRPWRIRSPPRNNNKSTCLGARILWRRGHCEGSPNCVRLLVLLDG